MASPPPVAKPAPPAAGAVAPTGPAGPGALEGVPPPEDGGQLPPPPSEPEVHFEDAPGWAVGLDARAGIGILTRSEARGAFAFAGGLLRGHFQYFEAGFFYDHADDAPSGGTFANFGGFAGAWLPFHNWVDFEAAVGLGSRRYTDGDPRYGAHGYALSSAALSLILGVSDRAHSDNIGGRVGGQLVITDDLSQHDKPWSVLVPDADGNQVLTHGTTHVGGLSLALVFTLGLDAGAEP